MPRFSPRTAVAGVVLSLTIGGALCPRSGLLQAQDEVPTVAVLKRIAEAVEGYHHAGRVWVVLDSARRVAGIHPSRDSANSELRRLRFGMIYGPIVARELESPFVPKSCVHIASVMHPYCNEQFPLIPIADIDSIRVTFALKNGEARTIVLPSTADAIFFSSAALDKFVFPYYARVYGVAEAAAMRNRMLREGRPPR